MEMMEMEMEMEGSYCLSKLNVYIWKNMPEFSIENNWQ